MKDVRQKELKKRKELEKENYHLRHNVSELQKTLNAMRDRCKWLTRSNELRKESQRQTHKFVDWLIQTNRIDKEDIKKFFPTKKEVISKKFTIA